MVTQSLSHVTWRSQLRVMLAITKKNWLHFVRYPLSAVFWVLQPIMWLAPIYFMGLSFQTPEGNVGFAGYAGTTDYMSFILIGTVLSQYVHTVFWSVGYSLKNEMDSGVLESNWLAPVPRFVFLVGQTVHSLLTTTLINVLLLSLGWLLYGFSVTGNVLPAVAAVLPMLLAIYGFGFGFAAVVLLLRDANMWIDISDYFISILAGSNFPVQVLPALLLPLSLALPLTYGYDAVRGLLINTTTLLPIAFEILILLVFMAITLPLGYLIFKLIERRCRRLGTLGMH
jgi:ABC-2 type transport system permease protein